MAQFQSPITGKMEGSAGDFIYYQLWGHACMRHKPTHYNDANHSPTGTKV